MKDNFIGSVLSTWAATFAAFVVEPPPCYINAQIVTSSVAQTPSKPTAKAAPKGTISTSTPSIAAPVSIPSTSTSANARDNTIKIVKIVIIPVATTAVVFLFGVFLFKRRRRKLRQTEKGLERSGEADAPPFLQMKPELDALQQRHELEAVSKEPCELEGQGSRQQMMTQADEDRPVNCHVQELGGLEPSQELDGKRVQPGKSSNVPPKP
ncbi:MAG: hypothetical protein L6R37_000988 [Teloschistes peruensis]|nr:MAG: hypothetical protein L6R37_000988 [Teloschistes peruensis]